MTGENSDYDFNGRIRSAMQECVKAVHQKGPYRSKNQLAMDCGPNTSTKYGYEIIDRCLDRDLIKIEEDHPEAFNNAKGAVVLTQKGQNFIEWLERGDEQ